MLLEKDRSVSIHDRNIQSLATEMYKVSHGLSPPVVSNLLHKKIVTLTICDLIHSFLDFLLGLYFTGPKVYPIVVQLSGTFFLIVIKTYLLLAFLKTGLKSGKQKIAPCRLCKTCISRAGLTSAFAPVSWMKLWHFSHSCPYKHELVFGFLKFIFIIKVISF